MQCTDDLVGMNDAHIVDPFDVLTSLRQQGGIVDVDVRELLGARKSAIASAGPTFTTLSYAAAAEVLGDPSRFSSRLTSYTLGKAMGRTMLELDPPEHTQNRGIVATAFRPREIERWVAEIIRPAVDELVDSVAQKIRQQGSADLVRMVAVPLPMIVITRMLGLPENTQRQVAQWAMDILGARLDPDRAMRAADEFTAYCLDYVEAKHRQSGDDLVSALVTAEVDGARLTREEVMSFVKLLFPAGAETTFRSIGVMLHALMHHPDQLDAVRNDRELVKPTIEEALRWQSVVGASSPRVAIVDTEVDGVHVPVDSTIVTGYAAVNRDPARWDDADRFDIHRPFRPHMAFGWGPHLCLGMHLARAEMTEVLNAVLDRLPEMRLDTQAPEQHVHGIVMRGPCAVPVVADV